MAYTIAFFGTKPYDEASFNDKNKEYGFELRYYKGHLNKHNVILTQNVDAVCIFVNDTADAEVLHMMADNGVKLLALRCAGYNNVDLKAAADCGITVVRVPAYSPYAVAEYTVALMLSLNRKIPRATWRTRDGNFSLHGLLGFDMYGKTVGIIGTGKIAKKLIMILRGFGMNVLAYDLYPDYNFAREHQVVYTTLDELYHSSDIISLHCPLTEQTKYLINDYSISKMKEGVMIINTGRGQLIHTNALIEGLKNKKIGSAGLDVYEEEGEYFYEDQSDRIIDDDVLARLLGFDMYGKTVGIIGTGKIAKKLIMILRGFGMNVLAYDLYPDYNFAREHQVVYTTLDELYHSSDIISLHCPLTEQTKYLINDYSISKMKEGVMIINTGRGQLIHTNALIEGLKNKKIGSAGLDVYEEEGEYFYEDQSDRIIDDDVLARLLSFNNVIVTSHQAFFTREALENIATTTLQNIKDFASGKALENEVKI